jgi:hypothetical protein
MAYGFCYYPYDEFGGSSIDSGFINIGPTSSVGSSFIFDGSVSSGMSLGLTQGFSLRNISGSGGIFNVQVGADLRPSGKSNSNIVLRLKLFKNGAPIEGSLTNNTFTPESIYNPVSLSTRCLVYLDNSDEISARFDIFVENGVVPDIRIFSANVVAFNV